jgi:hypothetical protein
MAGKRSETMRIGVVGDTGTGGQPAAAVGPDKI